MTGTITVRSHPRKRPASSIAAEERRKETTARLQEATAARLRPPPRDLRAYVIEQFQPWYWRQA